MTVQILSIIDLQEDQLNRCGEAVKALSKQSLTLSAKITHLFNRMGEFEDAIFSASKGEDTDQLTFLARKLSQTTCMLAEVEDEQDEVETKLEALNKQYVLAEQRLNKMLLKGT